MGRVWRGHDQLLDREVAIKEILLPDGLAPEQRHELVERAMREARAAARLHHPGIITVHDVVLHGGKPWIIMEFISGRSLAQTIARTGKLDWVQVARIGAALADALAHAHAAGIVHRDLKPDNVLLDGHRVVITDFGIARILDASLRLTASSVLVGTPQYMPPEQLDGQEVKAPGDLWALGATLYAAVEDRPPFDGSSLSAVWAAILTRPLPTPQHAGPLGPVLVDLMSKAPEQRPSARTAGTRLTALQHSHRPAQPGRLSPCRGRHGHHSRPGSGRFPGGAHGDFLGSTAAASRTGHFTFSVHGTVFPCGRGAPCRCLCYRFQSGRGLASHMRLLRQPYALGLDRLRPCAAP